MLLYNSVFKKTLKLKKEVFQLESELAEIQKIDQKLILINHRLKFADSILLKNNFSNQSIQSNLLEMLNKETSNKNLSLVEFTEPHLFEDENFTINSFHFLLRGNYNNIESILYNLEQQYNFGLITHVSFNKKRDHRKALDFLDCEVILESIISE
jgi:hypothetical protein